MKLLIISDIHANVTALEAVLRDAGAVDDVYCAGDYVDYGTDPREAIAWVKSHGVHCVIGNHDDATAMAEQEGDNAIAILPDEMHEICMKYNPTPNNYYYADLPSSDYRFVFLNSCDRPYRIGENGRFIQDYPLEISNA